MTDIHLQVLTHAAPQVQAMQPAGIEVQVLEPTPVELVIFSMGERGLPGNGGSGVGVIEVPFVQQSSIIYNHNLGRKVGVQVYDILGQPVSADIDNSNNNLVKIDFLKPISGTFLIF